MSLGTEIQKLEKLRDREKSLLRASIAGAVAAIESEPADWVGNHPYASTAGAALVGFIAAQVPLGAILASKAFQPPPPAQRPATIPAALPATATLPQSSRHVELLGLVVGLVAQFLEAQSAAPATACCIEAGDAGTASGGAFPHCFFTNERAGATAQS